MISYLENHQIDRAEWDSCIRSSKSAVPYAYSWYLDIMTPGWCALVDHDYRSVFPLPARQRFGISYIYIPPFVQCLGLFSKEISDDLRVSEIMGFIPEFYRFIDISITNNPGECGLRVIPRDNYRLSVKEDYPAISSRYSSDCRRNISKASDKKQVIDNGIDPNEAIELFSIGPGRDISGIRRSDYERLAKLMNYCVNKGFGELVGVRVNGKLIYSLFYIITPGQITLLFTATSLASREWRSGYLVIDQIIRENSGKNIVVDFAGSSIPSVAEYIKSFGAMHHTYFRIYKNILPWPYRIFR